MSQHQPAAGQARRPATWVVVLLTVGVMTAIGVAFVVGVLVGAWITRDDGVSAAGGPTTSGSGTDQGQAPSDGGTDAGSGAAGGSGAALDECLVGTWEGTEHTEDWRTEQGEAQLSDLRRTMTFTADGTQTIRYDQDRATITTDQGPVDAVFDGTVVYTASTSAGTMSFDLRSAEGTVTVDPGGAEKVEELVPGTGDVRYSCDDTTLRQEAEGYLSVYERAG